MKRLAILWVTLILTGLTAPLANAQVGERVAAVVNDDPISTFDVRQRIQLIIVTEGMRNLPQEALAQLQGRALRELIEERLKLQEAERFELTIPDEAIDAELEQLAGQAGTTVQQLTEDLATAGVNIGTLRDRIQAEQAWQQLVRGRYGPRVSITDDAVETMLDDLELSARSDQYLISEICLPVTRQEDQPEMYQAGMQMIEQLRRGVPFGALAQQYSACSSAARGGDLGWLRADELDQTTLDIVQQLSEGNVSRPIPLRGVIKIVALRQTREAATAGEPSYQVAYAGAPASLGEEVAKQRLARLPETNACNGQSLSIDMGEDVGATVLPRLPERAFEPIFRTTLAALDVGETSDVIESDGAFHRLMMCEKDEGYGLPTRRAVESRLESEELELLSRRYLRDIERESAIEIRYGGTGTIEGS
ncbi:peptidyl-prolyl cis-trans isomerase family protein [Parvularcula bermudensis HTCC2503]|uniref:Parvulin-like PPIase n=2 Tax=Parvularcula TaxID=208215 RepID=E0TCB0_PARBH|nr:peptidyl-prolyl cis-trans isomerase family protein [Parvularcula bermudensis HTCC2503]